VLEILLLIFYLYNMHPLTYVILNIYVTVCVSKKNNIVCRTNRLQNLGFIWENLPIVKCAPSVCIEWLYCWSNHCM